MFYYWQERNNFPPPRGYFVDRSEPIVTTYDWGRWHQNVSEVQIEIPLPPETVAKDLSVSIKTNQLDCKIKKGSKTLLKGKLHGKVRPEDSMWSIEDNRTLRVIMAKIVTSVQDNTWEGLFENEYLLEPDVALKVRNKIDMERFQLEVRY